MSTLKDEDFEIMNSQLEHAKGKMIDKQRVLSILHERLKKADLKNELIVDKIDGEAIKELINSVNTL